MGYYTNYSLDASPWPEELTDYLRENSNEYYGIDYLGNTTESVKWYRHEECMLKLSIKFPLIVFTLHGEGEEVEDIWRKHFLAGKMQKCKAIIDFEPFDINKLE